MYSRVLLGLLLAAASTLPAEAGQAPIALHPAPVISRAVVNEASTQITLTGGGFGAALPKVTLGGVYLTVVSFTQTQIVVNLPSGTIAGSYLLGVQNTSSLQIALFSVTLGTDGPQGPIGPVGPAGAKGLTGATGLTGITGAVGPQGIRGLVGVEGPIGLTGAAGLPGPVGAAGPIGAIGPVGVQGATGLTGFAGPVGPAGPIGLSGLAGASGAIGPIGLTGMTGPIGLIGATGFAGPQGSIGPAGPIGLSGLMGPAGPTGLIGAIGLTGATGPVGPIGTAGPTGATGVAGPSGPTGATGAVGPPGLPGGSSAKSVNFTTAFDNPGTGPANTIYYLSPLAHADPSSGNNQSIASASQANFAVVPAPCTVTGLNVGANNYYATGNDTTTIMVFKNQSPTSMNCSVSTFGNGQSCSDTTHIFDTNGGDTLTLAYSESNTSPFVRVTVSLVCQ